MKKLKLITSLSTLGMIGTMVPPFATSCNDSSKEDNTNYFCTKDEKIEIDHELTQDDLNAMSPVDHIYADNVGRKSIFVNSQFYPITSLV